MKKFKFSLMAAFAAAMILFTSCLGDKSNEETNSGIGFIQKTTTGTNVIYGLTAYGYPMASKILDDYVDIYGVNRFVNTGFKINYDSEENSGYANRGYAVAETLQLGHIEKYSATGRSGEIDKTPLENEVIPEAIASSSYYVENNICLVQVGISKYSTSDKLSYVLEFDYNQKPDETKKIDGKNVYEAYLRVKHVQSDPVGNLNYEELMQVDMTNLINTYKQHETSNSKGIYIRINNVSKIEDVVTFKEGPAVLFEFSNN